MSRRKYSDVEKAEAIAAVKSNNGNIFRTSQELNIPWTTLADWVKGEHGINPGVTELREQKEEELATICERVARKYLEQAENPWAIYATPGNQAMMTAAVAIDKNRLLLGQPTSISADVSTVQVTLARRISKIASKTSESEQNVEYQLQLELSDKSDEDYSPELDASVHPEAWPSGNLLQSKELAPQQIEGEQ
jgi:transposase-like protein